MWVVCCGMQRSGSTLQYQLSAAIVAAARAGRAIGWLTSTEAAARLHESADDPELCVFKCHMFIPGLAALMERGQAKAVYVYRDLRDVAVSTMLKNQRSFEQLLRHGTIRSVLENDRRWTGTPGIVVSRYEDMIGDISGEAAKIAAYLGVHLPPERLAEIAAAHTLDEQRRRIESFDFEKDGAGGGFDRHDPVTLLHRNHIFSGEPSGWQRNLTRLQVACIEHLAHDWLVAHHYPVSQNFFMRALARIRYRRFIAPG